MIIKLLFNWGKKSPHKSPKVSYFLYRKKKYMGSCICNFSVCKNEKNLPLKGKVVLTLKFLILAAFPRLRSSCSYYDFSFEEKVNQSLVISSFLFSFGLMYGLVLRNFMESVFRRSF